MEATPKCIVVTGRPGSGKTTLSNELSARLRIPKISRDEIKEGYVNTFGIKHDQLPKETNGVVNQTYFQVLLLLLRDNVSILTEAAFDHKIWDFVIPKIIEIADIRIIICDLSAELSAKRHLERGLADPKREFFHGDKRVAIFRETGKFEPGGEYIPPHYPVPTINVSTINGHDPSLEKLQDFIML